MNYTLQQFENAELITSAQYCDLDDPKFEGQTRLNENNEYKMYWSNNDKLYYTNNIL